MENIDVTTDRFRAQVIGFALAFGMLATSAVASAGEAETDGDSAASYENTWGPSVGTTIPTLDAQDREGESRDLESLTGERGLLLVISRSAHW